MPLPKIEIVWNKCGTNPAVWCSFENVNLAHEHFNGMEGVYVIWHAGEPPNVIRVGQGVVADRIAEHRNDKQITVYAAKTVFVTWAAVEKRFRNGVEAYLAAQLTPFVGERFPNVQQIQVNLPA